jgi:DNA-binding NtrC family response regulator
MLKGQASQRQSSSMKTLDESQFMRYRILVLSSDELYRRAVGLSLRQLNEDVLFAETIGQAAEMTEQALPTLLITDFSIAGAGDGMEFALAMHERFPQLQCIVTGDADLAARMTLVRNMPWLQVFQRPFSMVGFMTSVIRARERPAVEARAASQDLQPGLAVVSFPKRGLHDHPGVIRPAAAN